VKRVTWCGIPWSLRT